MKIQNIVKEAKSTEFLDRLDATRRQWIESKSGCGCNNAKIVNFVLTVCKPEFDAYCAEKGLV